MDISGLTIDRFGVWKGLRIDAFSQRMNVVIGPRSAAKKALPEFIRSVLFGFGDDIRDRYLTNGSSGGGGALVLSGPFGRQTINRFDAGDHHGRLTLEDGDGSMLAKHRLQDHLGSVRQSVFDRVFAPGIHDRSFNIEQLLEGARAHGFDLDGREVDTKRLAEVDLLLEDLRRSLADLPPSDDSLVLLNRQRESLKNQIESLQFHSHEHRNQLQRQLHKLNGEIEDLEEQCVELENELTTIETAIQMREKELAEQRRAMAASMSHEQLPAPSKLQELREIDAQLARWRSVLQDVNVQRQRYQHENVGHQMARQSAAVTATQSPRETLRSIETRIADLQARTSILDDHACHCRELRTTWQRSLQAMHDDVRRLCNELSQWQSGREHEQTASELQQLSRCERELHAATQTLLERRKEVLESLKADGTIDPLRLCDDHRHLCQCLDHAGVEQQLEFASAESALKIRTAIENETMAELERDIANLRQRHEEVQEDTDTVQGELARLRVMQRNLSDELAEIADRDQLERKHAELRKLEQRIADAERREHLLEKIATAESERRRIKSQVRQSRILREAAQWITAMTAGKTANLEIDRHGRLRIQHESGHWVHASDLAPHNRRHIYLGLSLALVAAYGREGVRLPVLLDDETLFSDNRRDRAVMKTLHDFAATGHQVLLFTDQKHTADWFRNWDVKIHDLTDAIPQHQPRRPQPMPEPTVKINQELAAIADEDLAPVADHNWSFEEFPGELTDRVRSKRGKPDSKPEPVIDEDLVSEYFLFETSPIGDAPSIDTATAERLRKIDVLQVGDLLRLSPEEAADRLRYAGITAEMIRRWQAEANLVCRVPRLRPYDSRILVACGIHDPQRLARMDVDELRQRVEAFAKTGTGQVLLRSGNNYELARLAEWIRAAKRSGTKNFDFDSHDPMFGRRHRRQSSVETRGTTRPDPVVLRMPQSSEPSDWKFYLDTSDSLVDAPSIGPRTAERFEEIGIVTVADFLNCNPQRAAERLGHRRITAETIQTWQQQAVLACRIPQLRGHDAQILVACGVTSPELLAKMNANELWRQVAPFVKTSEGKRIIRNGRDPDLAEVSAWIEWSQHARSLVAA